MCTVHCAAVEMTSECIHVTYKQHSSRVCANGVICARNSHLPSFVPHSFIIIFCFFCSSALIGQWAITMWTNTKRLLGNGKRMLPSTSARRTVCVYVVIDMRISHIYLDSASAQRCYITLLFFNGHIRLPKALCFRLWTYTADCALMDECWWPQANRRVIAPH